LRGEAPVASSGNVEKIHQPSPKLRQTSQRRSRRFADRRAALRGVNYSTASFWLSQYDFLPEFTQPARPSGEMCGGKAAVS